MSRVMGEPTPPPELPPDTKRDRQALRRKNMITGAVILSVIVIMIVLPTLVRWLRHA